jgi:hypothetical protein
LGFTLQVIVWQRGVLVMEAAAAVGIARGYVVNDCVTFEVGSGSHAITAE